MPHQNVADWPEQKAFPPGFISKDCVDCRFSVTAKVIAFVAVVSAGPLAADNNFLTYLFKGLDLLTDGSK